MYGSTYGYGIFFFSYLSNDARRVFRNGEELEVKISMFHFLDCTHLYTEIE